MLFHFRFCSALKRAKVTPEAQFTVIGFLVRFQNLCGRSLKFTRVAFHIRFYFMLCFNVHSKICGRIVNIIALRTYMLCRCVWSHIGMYRWFSCYTATGKLMAEIYVSHPYQRLLLFCVVPFGFECGQLKIRDTFEPSFEELATDAWTMKVTICVTIMASENL